MPSPDECPDNPHMAVYLMGDVQGCDEALARLLHTIDFSPSRDTLYLLGDLVNRGPDSLAVLRRLMALSGAAHCVLGNHDLHALAVASGVRKSSRMDTLQELLAAPDRDVLLGWLRQQAMALQAHGVLMVHAGVLPQWDAAQTLALADEVQQVLRCDEWATFLSKMYGGLPNVWDDTLEGADRLRIIVNALTRVRFCDAQGAMDFSIKEGADHAPPHLMPWFAVPHRRTQDVMVAFGHWSTLGPLTRDDVVCLDDGCVWGGCLSALRLTDARQPRSSEAERLSIKCEQMRDPLA